MGEAAHSTREQYQLGLLGSASPRDLHSGRSPGERPGFFFGERSENREWVDTVAIGEPAKILVTLTDRHRHHIRRNSRGKYRGSKNASLQ